MKSSDRAERERAEDTLVTIDVALEAGAPTGEDERGRELGLLALDLRAGAPEPSTPFAADLERRVESGFAAERSNGSSAAPRRSRARARRADGGAILDRRALGAFAAVLAALVLGGGVLASVGGLSGGGGGFSAGGDGAAPMIAPESSGDSGDSSSRGASPTETTVPPSGEDLGFAPGEPQRRIERTASLTLAAPEDRIDAVSEGIVAATTRHRGYLVSSSTFSGEDEAAGGSFDLRVPVEELRATLSELAALGTVRAQSQTGEDLTEPVATAADRLDGARADRRGLLRRLERAETDRQARALRRQLDLVSGEIRGLRGQLEALEERTDYARVSVTLTDESSSGATGTPSSTESALDDAVGSLLAAFNFSLRALGVLVPLAVAGGLAWLAFAAVRRRRREAVLG